MSLPASSFPPLRRSCPTGQARLAGGVARPGGRPSRLHGFHLPFPPPPRRFSSPGRTRAACHRCLGPPHRTLMLLSRFTSRRHPTCLLSLCPAFHSVKGASVCSVSCHQRGSCHGRGVAAAPRPPLPPPRSERGASCASGHTPGDSRGTRVSLCCAGGRVKTWKRRWFILTDNCLYYFEYTTVSACRGGPASVPGPLCADAVGGAVGTQSDCLLSSIFGVGGEFTGSGRTKKNPRPGP